jgi:hypothetical protein
MIDGEEKEVPQDSDDLREVSGDPLAKATIAQIDFVPAGEFPNQADNHPAIIPQNEVFDHAALGGSSQENTFTGAEHSNDTGPVAAQPAQLINREAGENISPVVRSRLLRFVVPVIIALLALGAASMLIVASLIQKPGINAAAEQNRMSDSGSKEPSVDSVQTEQLDRSAQPEPRLILEPNLSGATGTSIPLGTQVNGEAPGLALEIGGLPEGMTISEGRPLGTGAWRILASDVADATLNPPPGFAGVVNLVIELRLADDTVVDSGSLHREWDVPVTDSANSSDHETGTATGPDQNAVGSATDSQLDPAQIEFLLARSQAFISEGDVVSARIQLQRAAEARDARAALALGATYDPIMLAILQVNGVAADVAKARYWYEKAREFGSLEASQRLKLLENLRP